MASYKPFKILSLFSLTGMFLYILSPLAHAQADIDRATREVDRPVREEVEEKLRVPPSKPPVIEEEPEEKAAKGPRFSLKKVNLVGTESFAPEDFKPIIEKYENTEVTIEDLNTLAKEIERDYLRHGIIAVCYLPPQDVEEGTVTLRVVEARMGELTIEDHSFFDKERVANYWTIKPGEILRYDKMSQCLQLMNKNPDRDVRTTLHSGKKPKTTDVLLNVKTYFPIHLTASYDNEGSPSTGKLRKGVGIRDNNFLFVDDTFIFGYTYGDYFSGNYAYHRIPITNFGTTFMYGYNFSKAATRKDYEFLGLNSRTENTSFFLYQDIFRKEEYLGEIYCGIDAKDKTVKQIAGTMNRDRLRIIRVGGNFVYRGFLGGNLNVNPEFSQGVNAFGARRKNPLSSRNAENTFSKFKLGVRHKRPLPWDMSLSLNFKGMTTSEKLASQEEFYVGGIDSVRGYPSGDFLADDAYQGNMEILIPAFLIPEKIKFPYATSSLRDNITGVVFIDYAHGRRRGIPAGSMEKDIVNYASVGAGLRIRLFDQALLRLEWGIPQWFDRPITEMSRSRLHFSIDVEEKLIEETERIRKQMREEHMMKTARSLINNELKKPDSALRNELYSYMELARAAQEKGDLKASEEYYKKTLTLCQSVYTQALDYVKSCAEQQKKLRDDSEIAQKYQRSGDTEKAKELWQEIAENATIKPLALQL